MWRCRERWANWLDSVQTMWSKVFGSNWPFWRGWKREKSETESQAMPSNFGTRIIWEFTFSALSFPSPIVNESFYFGRYQRTTSFPNLFAQIAVTDLMMWVESLFFILMLTDSFKILFQVYSFFKKCLNTTKQLLLQIRKNKINGIDLTSHVNQVRSFSWFTLLLLVTDFKWLILQYVRSYNPPTTPRFNVKVLKLVSYYVWLFFKATPKTYN